MAVKLGKNWRVGFGFKREDMYMDAAGTLRVGAEATAKLGGDNTLLTSGDGSLRTPGSPYSDNGTLSPEAEQRKKIQKRLNRNGQSNAQIDYSMMRQSTLLGG